MAFLTLTNKEKAFRVYESVHKLIFILSGTIKRNVDNA